MYGGEKVGHWSGGDHSARSIFGVGRCPLSTLTGSALGRAGRCRRWYLVLAPFLSPTVLGLLFGAIAGVMVFLALDELLPAAKRYAGGHETTYAMVAGMGVLALSLVLLR